MSLLRPEAVLSKIVTGGGDWSVRKPRYGDPAFCLMLQGSCVLAPEGLESIELRHGDFLLFPEMPGFTLAADAGLEPTFAALDHSRHTRHGCEAAPVTMRMLGGYFRFDPPNAPLLVSLLPNVLMVRRGEPGSARLSRIVELIAEEADTASGCRDVILQRLVEVLLIEAVRVHPAPPLGSGQRGLIAGLADPVLAPALQQMHADIAQGMDRRAAGARRSGVPRGVRPTLHPNHGHAPDAVPAAVAGGARQGSASDRTPVDRAGRLPGRISVRQRLHHGVHPARRMLSHRVRASPGLSPAVTATGCAPRRRGRRRPAAPHRPRRRPPDPGRTPPSARGCRGG